MGSSISRKSDKDLNQLFLTFTGKDAIPISENDFWSSLLLFSFNATASAEEDKVLFDEVNHLCNHLYNNNVKSGNLGTFLHIFLDKVSSLLTCDETSPDLQRYVIETQNCIFIIRVILQHLVQKISEKEIIKHLNVKGLPVQCKVEESSCMLFILINALIDILFHVPLNHTTYFLHCESTNTVLVLLSCHLFTTLHSSELETYKVFYESKKADSLCKILIKRFIQQPKSPRDSGGGFLIGLASELMNLFVSPPQNYDSPIAVKSLLLCEVLINHSAGSSNLFKDCLLSFKDDMESLFRTICSNLHREENTLLLYHLVHKNNDFRNYVLNHPDIELLVGPMLQTIYNASSDSCPHMYMSLIVLLILTEDVNFNKRVHSIVLKNTSWYVDKTISEITLGGLLILVTTRAIQYNLLKMRDEYLHTNCLAALANMSSQFKSLHPYVCQRLVGLFEVLAKTYSIAKEELVAIERALRIILEVINSCLTNQLLHNPNLIYTLLHKKQIFEGFREHTAFQDIIQNVDQILMYFTAKIELEQDGCLDAEKVLSVIQKCAPLFPSHQLQKFPELKFKYVEEENPNEFFIPYVWSLVAKFSGLHCQPSLFEQC